MSKLRKTLPRAHFTACKGTAEQNRAYCIKDGDFEESGECPKPPGEMEKDRWEAAYIACQEHRIEDVPYEIRWKYDSTCQRIMARHPKKLAQADDVTGIWLHGVSGSGKSRYAEEKYPDAYHKDINKWWDGYTDQDDVIIEDMDPFHKSYGRLFKIWADRYPFPAEIKGGKMDIRPKRIIVTSQYTIHQIWLDPETRSALDRRFTSIAFACPPEAVLAPATQFPKEIPANYAQKNANRRTIVPTLIQETPDLPSQAKGTSIDNL